MKYRGLFDLVKRDEDESGRHKFALRYQARQMRYKTLKDAYKAWLKKYGKDVTAHGEEAKD